MNIKATWSNEIFLQLDNKGNLIFEFPETELTDEPGCYVFYNRLRKRCNILYVGKATNIKKRLNTQFNTVKLMNGIKKSGRGNKILMYCTIKLKGGQRLEKALATLEKNLIKYAFSQGHALLNKQGSKVHFHEIHFKGTLISQSLFGRTILSPLK
jgi:hypothetical protein